MFNWFSRRSRKDRKLTELVKSIAVLINEPEAFRAAAAQAAATLDSGAADLLSNRFHSAPDAPPGFGPEECGLTGWLSAWQFAIFELYFNLEESAIPVLRRVAYGEYDWTQGNAIEVLCRLAAKGIKRTAILTELKCEFPKLRYEAQLYAVQPLLAIAEEDASVAGVVEELMQIEEFRETVEELTEEYEEEEEEDPDNLCNEDWQGTVTEMESLDEETWNKRLIGAVTIEGLDIPDFHGFGESEGKARRLAIADTTRLQRLVDGETLPIDFHEIRVGSKIAVAGDSGFVDLTTPPTIYPEVITVLGGPVED